MALLPLKPVVVLYSVMMDFELPRSRFQQSHGPLSFRGQCFMKSLRVYSVISMKEIIIYIIFALHVVLYFL